MVVHFFRKRGDINALIIIESSALWEFMSLNSQLEKYLVQKIFLK